MKSVKQLVIGLPEAGKSTCFAALWHIVDAGRVPGSIRLEKVHGDQQYLNELRDSWSGCKPIERNRRGQGKTLAMRLLLPEEGSVIELTIPDPAGEAFSDQWERAQCPQEYVELAREAGGGLLFVNPIKVNQGLSIREVGRAAHAVRGQAGEAPPARSAQPWTPESAGTQVQLVELLQILLREPFYRDYLPVAVIISAWDQLLDDGLTPEGWLGEVLPLLHQYLKTNEDIFPSRVYGVSAQGGDLAKDGERLLAMQEPWKRVLIKGPECSPHDLTAPLRWLLHQEKRR